MKLWILLLLLLTSTAGHGASFFIRNGEPPETAQQTLNAGETGLIEAGGILGPTVPSPSVFIAGPAVLTNFGLITQNTGFAVDMNGFGGRFINRNTVSVTGSGSEAVHVDRPGTSIENTGLLRAVGDGARGINIDGNRGALIKNDGVIYAEGEASRAVNRGSAEFPPILVNRGLLYAVGDNSYGLFTLANDFPSEINLGSIISLGNNSEGYHTRDAVGGLFENHGTILGQGVGVTVADNSNGFRLINSGIIQSLEAQAVFFDSPGLTLTLLPGSTIRGAFSATEPFDLNVERGLNLALTLTPASPGFGALGIDAPFAVLGNTVHVIDRTGLAMQADFVADISDPILNNIYRGRTAFSCACYDSCGCGFWLEAIGAYRERKERKLTPYHLRQGGFILGYATPVWCGSLNFFAGASFGEGTVGERTERADTKTGFGGFSYERIVSNHFFGTACAAGYTNFKSTRYMMNNLAPDGVEKVVGRPNAFFISPEMTYAYAFSSWCYSPTLTGRVRYAGLFLGDYDEQGSVSRVGIKDRDIQLLTLRGELSLPKCTCFLDVEPYIGVSSRFQLDGRHVSAELLSQAVQFDSGLSDYLAALLIGLRSAKTIGCFDLFFDLEANWDSGSSYRLLGDVGIEVNF
ncbi:MAG: hypothetical protein S4CHLAM2_05020 [Chlamydiales bacterium]|nr:hypothetical protein [Chlamydiales bacterium]